MSTFYRILEISSACGPSRVSLILESHQDAWAPTNTTIGRANIKRFNESDPWQEEIAGDEEFYRSQIVKDDRTGKMVVRVGPLASVRVTSGGILISANQCFKSRNEGRKGRKAISASTDQDGVLSKIQ
jgi:hypothetical protein